jgi:hypothetical protein
MFVDVILVHVVEMAVVKVVHMAVMANPSVPAVRAMLVGVIGMMLLGTARHDCVLSSFGARPGPLVTVPLQPSGNTERATTVPEAGTNPGAREFRFWSRDALEIAIGVDQPVFTIVLDLQVDLAD